MKQLESRGRKSGSVLNHCQENKELPNSNYGSFFRPPQPAIAQRVIKEVKAMLDQFVLKCFVSDQFFAAITSIHPWPLLPTTASSSSMIKRSGENCKMKSVVTWIEVR